MQSKVLDEIAQVAGYTPTRYLVVWYAGKRLSVPAVFDPQHPLRWLMGLVPFRALVRAFGGQRLKIPKDTKDSAYQRDRLIAERLAAGASLKTVAEEFRLTRQRASQIRGELYDRDWLRFVGILGTGEVFDDDPPGGSED
jgi:hypothetical protein